MADFFGFQVVKTFLQQATISGTRSTALKFIKWMLSTLLAATLVAYWIGAPGWLAGTLGILSVFTALFGSGCYLYFMFKNPDFLRSEKFTLRKLEIEKGLIGDDVHGLMAPEKEVSLIPPALPTSSSSDSSESESD